MRQLLWIMLFIPAILGGQTLVGEWTFDNGLDLLHANVGNNLTLVGTHTVVPGPTPTNGAVNIGVGSYYQANHSIPANGGGNMVNEFTLVIDFKVNSIGQWYTFFQTAYQNNNDGDAFINPSGQIGVAATGYSPYTVSAGEWYRLVVAADLGSSYKYYLDGQLLQDGGAQTVDGRFSLYPANAAQPLLFFADDNAEDNPINVAYCAVYNGCLTTAQAGTLGGYGHAITPPSAEMLPYLQSPTPTSMYVCWHGASGDESRVEYGTTSALGSTATGTVYTFNSTTKWHSVKLENLSPATTYYYQCHTGSQVSAMLSFKTPSAAGSHQSHFRFIIMGDSQSNAGVSANIVNHVVTKLTELYGANWQNEVQLLCHVGDAVGNGTNLASYITEHFIPFSPLSGKIPIMEAIGNHEMESPYYYNYKKYEDFAGPEDEKYYSFDINNLRFIFLNPNIATGTESTWLQSRLTDSQYQHNYCFTFCHMPAYSEIWPDGNSTWVQNTVLPALENTTMLPLLASGHSHCYERGVSPQGKVTTLISGGAGGALDRWGMYDNQQDYTHTIKSLDMYNWILVDVNGTNNANEVTYTMYSLGNTDRLRDNEVMDSLTVINGTVGGAFMPVYQTAAIGGPLTLTSWYDRPENTCHAFSTHYVIATDPDFVNIVHDGYLYNSDVYGDTGAPLWNPIEHNSGVDLHRYHVPNGVLTAGTTYYWKLYTRWANNYWYDTYHYHSFVMQYQPPAADFQMMPDTGVQDGEYFKLIETSVGEATDFAWDFDGDGITDSTERDPYLQMQWGFHDVTLTCTIDGQAYSVTKTIVIAANDDPSTPIIAASLTAYPNPFSSKLEIKAISSSAGQQVVIYNLKGERVKALPLSREGKATWDGTDMHGAQSGNGLYILRYQSGDKKIVSKAVMLMR